MKWMLIAGAVLGALAVAFGAFGAHALEGVLDERARGWYDTAVAYHAAHAFAVLVCGLLALHVVPPGSPPSSAPAPSSDSPSARLLGSPSAPSLESPSTASPRSAAPLRLAGIAFLVGVTLFSGSLYTMAFTGWTMLGIVTPFGGIALIAGWILLAVAAARLPVTLS